MQRLRSSAFHFRVETKLVVVSVPAKHKSGQSRFDSLSLTKASFSLRHSFGTCARAKYGHRAVSGTSPSAKSWRRRSTTWSRKFCHVNWPPASSRAASACAFQICASASSILAAPRTGPRVKRRYKGSSPAGVHLAPAAAKNPWPKALAGTPWHVPNHHEYHEPPCSLLSGHSTPQAHRAQPCLYTKN